MKFEDLSYDVLEIIYNKLFITDKIIFKNISLKIEKMFMKKCSLDTEERLSKYLFELYNQGFMDCEMCKQMIKRTNLMSSRYDSMFECDNCND